MECAPDAVVDGPEGPSSGAFCKEREHVVPDHGWPRCGWSGTGNLDRIEPSGKEVRKQHRPEWFGWVCVCVCLGFMESASPIHKAN